MSTSPEATFFTRLKRRLSFDLYRIESRVGLGMPDVLLSVPLDTDKESTNRLYALMELKVTRNRSIKFSPHQVSFHLRNSKCPSYILVHFAPLTKEPIPRILLFHSSAIMDLMIMGIETPGAIYSGWARVFHWAQFETAFLDHLYSW